MRRNYCRKRRYRGGSLARGGDIAEERSIAERRYSRRSVVEGGDIAEGRSTAGRSQS